MRATKLYRALTPCEMAVRVRVPDSRLEPRTRGAAELASHFRRLTANTSVRDDEAMMNLKT
jgi:hypothetical protein